MNTAPEFDRPDFVIKSSPRDWLLLGLITLLLTFICIPTLSLPFNPYDDQGFISYNPLVTRTDVRWEQFITERPMGAFEPLTTLSNRMIYQTFGDNPYVFRLTCLLLHLLNTWLLFFLLRRLIGDSIACWGAITGFALHPLQTEMVVWISSRNDLQAVACMLSALCLYAKLPSINLVWRQRLTYFLVLVFSTAALLFKSNMVVAPALLLMVDFTRNKSIRKGWLQGWQRLVPIALISFSAIVFFYSVARTSGNIRQVTDTSLVERWMGTVAIFSRVYLKNIFSPFSILPGYGESLTFTGLSIAHLTTVLFLGVTTLLWRYLPQEKRIKFLAIAALAFIPFLPYSNVFATTTSAANHYFYLPVIFFGYLVGTLSQLFFQPGADLGTPQQSRTSFLGVLACAIFLGGFMWQQALQWQTPAVLWRKTLAAYPNSFLALFLVGNDEMQQGNLKGARQFFEKALQVNPGEYRTRFNLASILVRQEKYSEAGVLLGKLLQQRSDDYPLFYYLGFISHQQGDYETAAAKFEQAANLNPSDPNVLFYLGLNAAQLNQFFKAAQAWEKVVAIQPNFKKAVLNLALLYGRHGNTERAMFYGQHFLKICPECAEASTLRKIMRIPTKEK